MTYYSLSLKKKSSVIEGEFRDSDLLGHLLDGMVKNLCPNCKLQYENIEEFLEKSFFKFGNNKGYYIKLLEKYKSNKQKKVITIKKINKIQNPQKYKGFVKDSLSSKVFQESPEDKHQIIIRFEKQRIREKRYPDKLFVGKYEQGESNDIIDCSHLDKSNQRKIEHSFKEYIPNDYESKRASIWIESLSREEKLNLNRLNTNIKDILKILFDLNQNKSLADFLIITAYHLKNIEQVDCFSLKLINSRLFNIKNLIADHFLLNGLLDRGLIQTVLKTDSDITTYKITELGEQYCRNNFKLTD